MKINIFMKDFYKLGLIFFQNQLEIFNKCVQWMDQRNTSAFKALYILYSTEISWIFILDKLKKTCNEKCTDLYPSKKNKLIKLNGENSNTVHNNFSNQ